jgi:2-aminoadipate transaminase
MPPDPRAELQTSRRAGWAAGQPISELMAQALANPALISLAAGFVDQSTLPDELTRYTLEEIFADPIAARAALQYGTTIGYPPLREAILSRLRAHDGSVNRYERVTIDQIVVTAGSNQLLQLVADALLEPGDIVLCAAPSYFVFLGTLANLGVRSIGVATDERGLLPEALDATFGRLKATGELPRVKAVYCVSYFDNPCGVSLAEDRRPRVLEVARRWSQHTRILVIEDVAYRELRYSGREMPSIRAYDDAGDAVVLAGTFSKSFSPGIRVGWGVLPPELVGPVLAIKGNADFGSPNFAQHMMHRVLESGRLDAHVGRLRAAYQIKLAAMLEAAREFLGPLDGVRWIEPLGGLYVWVELPPAIDAGPGGRLFTEAQAAGVLYVPGEYCYPGEGVRKTNSLRLSFGVQTPPQIRRGMELLAAAIGRAIGH